MDVVTPGVDIFTTTNGNSYATVSGTSFAAPMVSGIAALLLSIDPNLTPAEVRQAIESTCDKVQLYYGNRRER